MKAAEKDEEKISVEVQTVKGKTIMKETYMIRYRSIIIVFLISSK